MSSADHDALHPGASRRPRGDASLTGTPDGTPPPPSPCGIAWLRARLHEAWSSGTSSLWTERSPARGQCGVTALVINDHLGGEILKTPVGHAWHFYNRVDGRALDLTSEQFTEPIEYLDVVSSREEAFADTDGEKYRELARRFAAAVERADE